MAEKKPQTSLAERALRRLTPNSFDLKIDGQDVRVATNKEENQILNMILISQGRSLIQSALKKWKDMEETPSPKELRDIIASIKDLSSGSNEIYAMGDPLNDKPGEKTVDKGGVDDLDFSKITKPIEVKANETGEQSDANQQTV